MLLVLATYVLLGAFCGFAFGRARRFRSEFVFRELLLGGIGATTALLVVALAGRAGGGPRWWSGLLAVVGAGAALAVHALVAAIRHTPDESARDVAYRGVTLRSAA